MKRKLKQLHRLSILLVLLCLGCGTNHSLMLNGGEFYGRNKVIKNIKQYDVYVHDQDSIYKIKNVEISDQEVIQGIAESVDSSRVTYIYKELIDNQIPEKEVNDIHIFIKTSEPNNKIKTVGANGQIKIEKVDIGEVNLVSKRVDESTGGKFVLGVLLVFLLAVMAVLGLLYWAVVQILNSCYIATMVYGDYDAEKVLILRKFRDQFLQKFLIGRGFIVWYYATSAGLIEILQSKTIINTIIRGILNGFVFLIKPFYKN